MQLPTISLSDSDSDDEVELYQVPEALHVLATHGDAAGDCFKQPVPTHKPSVGRLLFLTLDGCMQGLKQDPARLTLMATLQLCILCSCLPAQPMA